MTPAPDRWLADRLADAPVSLRAPMEAALAETDPALPLAVRLRRAGDTLLDSAAGAGAGRDGALTLLAADALVTLAAEYIALTAPGNLAGYQ